MPRGVSTHSDNAINKHKRKKYASPEGVRRESDICVYFTDAMSGLFAKLFVYTIISACN